MLICAHAQAAAQRLYFPVAGAAPTLDKQEAEALQWAADGVSVWVTGDKMRISNHGVDQLLAAAQRKLGAPTRPAAVLRAIEGGLIER
jgi:DNA-binding CsgD family transcriptional regulator